MFVLSFINISSSLSLRRPNETQAFRYNLRKSETFFLKWTFCRSVQRRWSLQESWEEEVTRSGNFQTMWLATDEVMRCGYRVGGWGGSLEWCLDATWNSSPQTIKEVHHYMFYHITYHSWCSFVDVFTSAKKREEIVFRCRVRTVVQYNVVSSVLTTLHVLIVVTTTCRVVIIHTNSRQYDRRLF